MTTNHATPNGDDTIDTAGPWRRTMSRFRKNRLAMIALGFLCLLALAAIFAPLITRHDPNVLNPAAKFEGPSSDHWLGTDNLGRDTYTRIVFGARISVRTGIQVLALAQAVAIPIGLFAGYRGGKADYLIMRLMDALGSIPALVLALAVVSMLGPEIWKIGIALSVVVMPSFVRIIRAQTLAVREETFVEASLSIGTHERVILLKRILPNVASPLIVAVAIASGGVLIAESSLAVLGFSAPPPDPTWGAMIKDGFEVVYSQPWQILYPGIVLALTVLAFNTVGDGIRDALGLGLPSVPGIRGRLGITSVLTAPSHITEADTSVDPDAPLLSVKDLAVEFHTEAGAVTVVDSLNLEIKPGEIVGLVGESGSGKSVTSLAIMRLLPTPPARVLRGSVTFDGQDIMRLGFEDMRRIRGSGISMVFQDSMTSLNPAFTVGNLLTEVVRRDSPISKNAAQRRSEELLALVEISDPARRMNDYPHQMSGGMRQRVMMAMALAREPKLLIADEPTTALDVTVQAQILDLLRGLQAELGMAVLLITHDLSVVADICDRVAVMYAGRIVEEQSVHALFEHPLHPYTEGLLGAMPQLAQVGQPLTTIPGVVPLPSAMPQGCRFAPRCAYAIDACSSTEAMASKATNEMQCIRADELELRGAL